MRDPTTTAAPLSPTAIAGARARRTPGTAGVIGPQSPPAGRHRVTSPDPACPNTRVALPCRSIATTAPEAFVPGAETSRTAENPAPGPRITTATRLFAPSKWLKATIVVPSRAIAIDGAPTPSPAGFAGARSVGASHAADARPAAPRLPAAARASTSAVTRIRSHPVAALSMLPRRGLYPLTLAWVSDRRHPRLVERMRRGERGAAARARRAESHAVGIARRTVRGLQLHQEQFDDVTLAHEIGSAVHRCAGMPRGGIGINAEDGVVFLRGVLDRCVSVPAPAITRAEWAAVASLAWHRDSVTACDQRFAAAALLPPGVSDEAAP